MSYPPMPPHTGIGSLQNDVRRLENEIRRKADDYKVSSLDSRMGDLVNAIREISSVCDAILSRLATCEENQQEFKRQLQDKGIWNE